MTTDKHKHLSKCLSWLLRHGALKEGLHIGTDGYINAGDLLNHKSLKDEFTLEDIKTIVKVNDKQRFSLRYNDGILQICANQGHSIANVKNLKLIPLSGEETLQIWSNIDHRLIICGYKGLKSNTEQDAGWQRK
ncbi:hypothetical protein JTB14_008258 [Gonioctena quinquepunctata]|nr:hypothetical protein JTB14_008258 [Gonioctena quinquepunctata]